MVRHAPAAGEAFGLHFDYWGKAKPQHAGDKPYHLLPYHCLDVAAVALEYLRRTPHLRRFLMESLQIESVSVFEAWITFWMAIHDLGKYSEAFQAQRADLHEQFAGRKSLKQYSLRHDSLGMLYFKKRLEESLLEAGWFGPGKTEYRDGLRFWARAVTGHHGQPPDENSNSLRKYFDTERDVAAINAFLADLRGLRIDGGMTIGEALPAVFAHIDVDHFERVGIALSWWIAGLAVLADWLGSNTDYFRYQTRKMPLSRYWMRARLRAAKALAHSGVLPRQGRSQGGMALRFDALFPGIATPSPLQQWAADVELSAAPQIHLLEDVTGAGKTEAAMMLAHRIMAAGGADGFFIGLPTTATANAMYGRVARFYRTLFEGDSSLVLANGQRDLVEQFVASVLPAGHEENDPLQKDDTATARCTAWLADHNKRALLSPAGVGTVDQALLAVLQSRHQSLRLLGLFRKILIVDEVHACDAYMQRVLECLLYFHAAGGGSAILLSATLPQAMRQSLLNAYARGAGHEAPDTASTAYPLVTGWSSGEPNALLEQALQTRPDVRRTLSVKYASDLPIVVDAIDAALAQGRCVCWIRNTVADAMEAHAQFSTRMAPEKLTLFHARFALHDRLRIERKVLALFGKRSKGAWRSGRLVIATQIVEQSLDADWDVIVSDLAPIDRLIQRAGRLQRHVRDRLGNRLHGAGKQDERGTPCFWVYGPQWKEEPAKDWYQAVLPRAARVYQHHEHLWLTAQLLQRGNMSMPDDARDAIEHVFSKWAAVPAQLMQTADVAQGKEYGDASMADHNTVKLEIGYEAGSSAWWNEARAPSRLGEATIDVLLARWEGDVLVPWVRHRNPRHNWAYSTVRVPERLISETWEDPQASPARQAAVKQTLMSLPNQGKWLVLLALEKVEQGWVGKAAVNVKGKVDPVVREWRYDLKDGLAATLEEGK